MKIQVAVQSDVGRVRDHNEDSPLVDESLGLFAVCDGMGGHAAGEVASELACRTVRQTVLHAAGVPAGAEALSAEESARLEAVLRNALENANAEVYALGMRDPSKHGAGTTCTALLVRASRAFLAHVGDCRAYLWRNGELHRLSTDHSLLDAVVRRGMPKAQAEAAFGSNLLLRAIGPQERVAVDTLVFDVLPGDQFLLCSDGLHGYLRDDQELLPHFAQPLAAMAAGLVALANDRGGEDNVTVLTLRVDVGGWASAGEQQHHSRVAEDLSALAQMELFSELAYPELLETAETLQTETCEPNQLVLAEGETSDNLYVIASGEVQVERGGEVIATLGPGCHFGEMAVLTNRPRAASVRATRPTRLLALTRPALYLLFERRPAIGMKFLWKLAQVQSLRLDEAMLWRSVQPRRDDEPVGRAAGLAPGRDAAGELAPPFTKTLSGFPAPLSRRLG